MTGAMLTQDRVFIGDSPLFFCADSTPRFSSVRGASRTSDRGADALLEKSVPIDDLRGWRVS